MRLDRPNIENFEAIQNHPPDCEFRQRVAGEVRDGGKMAENPNSGQVTQERKRKEYFPPTSIYPVRRSAGCEYRNGPLFSFFFCTFACVFVVFSF